MKVTAGMRYSICGQRFAMSSTAAIGGEKSKCFARFEDLTEVFMKIVACWNVTLCTVINMYQNVKGTFYLHLHGGSLMDVKQMIRKEGKRKSLKGVCSLHSIPHFPLISYWFAHSQVPVTSSSISAPHFPSLIFCHEDGGDWFL